MNSLRAFFLELRLKKVYKTNRKTESTVYKETLLATKKVLVIYPVDKVNVGDADNVLRMLFNYFENSKFTIIKPNELNNKMINFIGLPKKKYFEEFHSDIPFDLTIDLNLKFNNISIFIIGMIESKLNIRFFKNEKSDSIYHLSICNNKDDLTSKIITMKTYLDRIKSTYSLA